MTSECPTCGKTFKNDMGVRSHHSQKHDGSGLEVEKVAVECDYCDSTIRKYPSVAEQSDMDFCDKECHRKWQSECKPTEEHNWYSGGPALVECAECGESIERRPCKLERSEKFFCSKDCESDYKTGKRTGEDHPNWKGGVRYDYGPNWHDQRKKRLEKDGFECVVCSKSNAQEREETGASLTVHHIRPLREFGDMPNNIDYEMANRVENLITMCKSCHRRWEGIPLRPQA